MTDYNSRSRAFYTERLQAMRDNPALLPQVADQESEENKVYGVGLNRPDEVSVFERLRRASDERDGTPTVPAVSIVQGARRPGSPSNWRDREEPIPVEESHHVSLMTRTKLNRGEETTPVVVSAALIESSPVPIADLKVERKSREPKPAHPRPAVGHVPDPVHPQARRPAGGN